MQPLAAQFRVPLGTSGSNTFQDAMRNIKAHFRRGHQLTLISGLTENDNAMHHCINFTPWSVFCHSYRVMVRAVAAESCNVRTKANE